MFKRLTPRTIEQKAAACHLNDCFGPNDAELSTAFVPYRIRPLGAHLDHQGGKVCPNARPLASQGIGGGTVWIECVC